MVKLTILKRKEMMRLVELQEQREQKKWEQEKNKFTNL